MDNTLTVYRGITQPFNSLTQEVQPITWTSLDYSYAAEYSQNGDIDAKPTLLELQVDLQSGFSFGFRTLQVEVKLSEVKSRIKRGLVNQYELNLLDDDTAFKLMDELDELDGEGYMRAWEWYMKVPALAKILEEAGYTHIVASEGINNDIPTYGIIKKACIASTVVRQDIANLTEDSPETVCLDVAHP